MLRVVASLLLLLLCAGDAAAQHVASCDRVARQWAASCAEASAISVVSLRCASGFATFRVSAEEVSLDVEVRATPKQAFRQAGNRGVSPIGNFADWSAEPEATRAAFDAVAACVERGVPDAVFLSYADDPGPPTDDVRAYLPWRVIGALVALALVIAAYAQRIRFRRLASTSAQLLALGVATWLVRRAFFPSGFFHQNGHGPMWVDCALGEHCVYGPGFRDVFGLVASIDIDAAERGVFLAQSLLAATAPVSAWILARSLGARRPIAWAIAACIVLEPGLSRLSQSESYFGTTAALLFAAAAILAAAGRIASTHPLVVVPAAVGAGLLLGQAAVIHPVAWLPAALLPAIPLFAKGAPRRRWRSFFLVALGTGATAALSSSRTVLRVFDEHRRWSASIGAGAASELIRWTLAFLCLGAVVLGIFFWARRWMRAELRARLRRLLLATALLFVTVALGIRLHPFDAQSAWIQHAAWSPYLPVLAVAVAVITSLAPRRASLAAALSLGLVGLAHTVNAWPLMTTLPTDVLEANLAFSWRDVLPNEARVVYLERLDRRIAMFPVYRSSPRRIKLTRLRLDENHDRRQLEAPIGPGDFYYRSSVCSSAEGRPVCQRLESRWALEPVHLAVLPSVPSMPYLPHDTAEVHVGLYRIVGEARNEEASAERP